MLGAQLTALTDSQQQPFPFHTPKATLGLGLC